MGPADVGVTGRPSNAMSFAVQMRELEQQFSAAAAGDGNVYLPNFTPVRPVDAVLIAMEPSMGGWARNPTEATQRVAAGLRNFMWSSEAVILHWAARRYLCAAGQSYHITDISKGAMLVANAQSGRRARYDRWAPLLKAEIDLVAKPGARTIAIGEKVSEFLLRSGVARDFKSIIHYSPLAGAARSAAVMKLGQLEFEQFAKTFSMESLVEVVREFTEENAIPAAMAAETIERLVRSPLTESQKKLAFVYSTTFKSWHATDRA